MAILRASAVLIRKNGGPEVLEQVEVEVADPGPGELRILQTAVGLNFSDVYQRRGSHGPQSAQPFPIVMGSQAAGVVESLGDGVTGFSVGDKVAYIYSGAYASARVVPAGRVIALPTGLNEEAAAASLMRGLTAEYLLHRVFAVKSGQTVLVHAAAGGMGQLLAPWARALGAQVIGTVGSDAKIEVAKANGCHEVINYRTEDFPARVMALTSDKGVHVAYDAIGRDVFLSTLDCMAVRGLVVNYGTASGDVDGLDLVRLHSRSLSVCRPTLRNFIATRAELQSSVTTFAAAVRDGYVKAEVAQRFPLSQVREAHLALEGGKTTGSTILIP